MKNSSLELVQNSSSARFTFYQDLENIVNFTAMQIILCYT